MKRILQTSLPPMTSVLRDLRSSPGHEAPASLLPAVLRRVGLADLYVRLVSMRVISDVRIF